MYIQAKGVFYTDYLISNEESHQSMQKSKSQCTIKLK